MCTSNVNDRWAAGKEYSIVLAAHDTNNGDNITNRAMRTKHNSIKTEYND